MIRYFLGRLISVALTCTVVSVIVFLMMHAVPGGPFDGNDMPVNDAVKAKLNPASAAINLCTSSISNTCGACCTSTLACLSYRRARRFCTCSPARGRPA